VAASQTPPTPDHDTQTASNNAATPPAVAPVRPADPVPARTPDTVRTEPRSAPAPSATPRNLGSDVVAKVPTGYSTLRLTGILTCATIALFLTGFLVWAMGEKAKMKAH
jgi:hypothetical protein